jgi:acetoacetyl-CoA synthetase
MDVARSVPEGTLLWEPSPARVERSNMAAYLSWLKTNRDLSFATYGDLWTWSVSDLDAFWSSIWDYFRVPGERSSSVVLQDRAMPGARWFPDARLNYAQLALRGEDSDIALVASSERGPTRTLTYGELRREVFSLAVGLRRLGVGKGDRVAAFLPNIPEAVVGFLATCSLGAVWSSCSPEFGTESVTDRFRQIRPKVLIAVDGYAYAGRTWDRSDTVHEIRAALPELEHTVVVSFLHERAERPVDDAIPWTELLLSPADEHVEPVAFDHPLWILYSSGTTGPPKPIVQGHGGIVLEHLKALSLHLDLTRRDRFFWFTTTGWMMWNLLVGGLLVGSSIVLYDGAPMAPSEDSLWRMAEEVGVTYFGTSAPYIHACMKAGLVPRKSLDLKYLRTVGSTASPLSPDGFAWIYDNVKKDVLVGSISGGTDVCTSLLISCPLLPVHAGELQCSALGAKVEAFDEDGGPVIDEVGELVVTEPMPSMPVFFWGDTDGHRYRESYFEAFPGVWRHGDWIRITSRGSSVISGRSDSTLNRSGVRMGTSEFYRVVEKLPEVEDSLVVQVEENGRDRLLLFIVPTDEAGMTSELRAAIDAAIRSELSPRHVPDEIVAAPAIPRTLNGKKLEIPIRRILMGADSADVLSSGTAHDLQAVSFFVTFASSREISRRSDAST